MKVQNLIQSAIQEKENEFLRQENAKLNAKVRPVSCLARSLLLQNKARERDAAT